jgi:hypothetical protein
MKRYTEKKAELIRDYEYYQNYYYQNEENEMSYHKRAEYALDAILQKKLFNLQLQWRAGLLRFDEVKISFDFVCWGHLINTCPFLPLITDSEIKLMKKYLEQIDDPVDFDLPIYYDCQNYDDLMKKDESGDRNEMPDWYEFYDNLMGTASLLVLPDVRGNREEFYQKLIAESNSRNNPSSSNKAEPVDDRPFPIGFDKNLIDFSKQIETDPYIKELFKYFEFEQNESDEKADLMDIKMAIDTLSSADRPVHFDPHKNWDEAILSAAFKYKNVKTIEALDYVYEEYLMYKNLGLTRIQTEREASNIKLYEGIRKMCYDDFLKGRSLNGETEDSDF